MPDLERLPWDLPVAPAHTVGWVFRSEPDVQLRQWIRPGAVHSWKVPGTGKEPGQPVLLVDVDEELPTWVGWGHILERRERWRVMEVPVGCAEVIHPPLAVREPTADLGGILTHENSWENRALGTMLGFLRYQDRTPYREVGALSQRLTSSDLRLLGGAQPRLRTIGRGLPPSM